MNSTEKDELLQSLNESHERFIEGLMLQNGALCLIAYRNYVVALGALLADLS